MKKFLISIFNPPIDLFVFKIYIYWLLLSFVLFLFFSQAWQQPVSYIILGITVFGILILRLMRDDIKIPVVPSVILGAFLLFSIISTFFSINIFTSITNLIFYLSIFILFILSFDIFSSWNLIKWFMYWVLFITCIFCIYAIYHYLIGYDPRLTGTLLSPDTAAGFLIMIIPFSFYMLINKYKSRFITVMSVLTPSILVSSLFITFSRAAYLSMLVAIILFGIVLFRYFSKNFIKVLFFLLLTIGLSYSLSLLQPHVASRVSLSGITNALVGPSNISRVDRIDVYKRSLSIIKNFPIVGSGLGTFGEIFKKYQDIPWVYFDYTHNQYLQIFVEEGIIGGLIFLSYFIYLGFIGLRNIYKDRFSKFKQSFPKNLLYIFIFSGVLASMLHVLLDYDWEIIPVFFLFSIMVGMCFNLYKDTKYIYIQGKIVFISFIISILFILFCLYLFLGELYFKKGESAYYNNNLSASIIYLKRSTKFLPFDSAPYVWEALAYGNQMKYNVANSLLNIALKLDPYNADIMNKIGENYVYANKHKQALSALYEAYDFNKYSDPSFVLDLSEDLSYLRYMKKAVALYKQAITKYFPLNSTYRGYSQFYKLNGVDVSLGYIYLNLYILTGNKKYYKISNSINGVSIKKTFSINKK